MPQLLNEVTCLHCWSKFQPADILWQSVHPALLGDPRLGPEQQLRFLPSHFTASGNAIDAHSEVCHQIACPNCHLSLPRSVLERKPVFTSILGSPSCGKSFFLAALTSTLRQVLPAALRLNFADADPISNQALLDYEEQVFLADKRNELRPLADLIPKTQLGGQLYNAVNLSGRRVTFSRPFSFNIDLAANHPGAEQARERKRILCLYDNAGEHFLPGADTSDAPGTRHLAESRFLTFLFDPTQDPRWCEAAQRSKPEKAIPRTPQAGRQELILAEAAMRIRRHLGLPDAAKYQRPLIVVLNKVDMWRDWLPKRDWRLSPIWRTADGQQGVDIPMALDISTQLRRMMLKRLLELVYTAESFAQHVYYLPASALGRTPTPNSQGVPCIRPKDIRPAWVAIPFLLGMALTTRGLIARGAAQRRPQKPCEAAQLDGAAPADTVKTVDTVQTVDAAQTVEHRSNPAAGDAPPQLKAIVAEAALPNSKPGMVLEEGAIV